MVRLRLTADQLFKITQWLSNNNVTDGAEVIIEESNTSGIGPSVEVKTKTSGVGGIWLDLTDIDKW